MVTANIEILCCYARKDQPFLLRLRAHLKPLERQGLFRVWTDTDIAAGIEWEREIKEHLDSAHLILLLISPDFLASDYCYGREMKRALERHHAGSARVIPIILRRVRWENAPFSKLQVLPTEGKPVAHWRRHDDAYWDITEGIHRVIEELSENLHIKENCLEADNRPASDEIPDREAALFDPAICSDPEQAQVYIRKGNALGKIGRDEEALAAYEEAIRLDPGDASAYFCKGNALANLYRFEEALVAFEQAIRLDPYDADHHHNKGRALYDLHRYNEALTALEDAIRLDPYDAHYYESKRETLVHLRRYKEALVASEQAISRADNATFYNGKGIILIDMYRNEEALEAIEQAICLDPYDATFYHNKGLVLKRLKRYKEALIAYEQAIHLDPKDADHYVGKGEVLKKLNLHKEATEAYEEAARLEEEK